MPIGFWVLLTVAAAVLVMFRQSRFGWHVLAIGGNRKAASHGGIPVKSTIFLSYVLTGAIVGVAGFLFAARQNSVGSDTGIGLEFFALTALVVGLGGFVPGRGAVVSALIGFAVIFMLNNALLNAGLRGDFVQFCMGAILIVILGVDVKFRNIGIGCWPRPISIPSASRRRARELDRLMPDRSPPKLAGAEILGAGKIDGPEDVLLDAEGHLYCGTRDGYLVRLAAPDHTEVEHDREDRRPAARHGARSRGAHRRLRRRHGPRPRDARARSSC